MASLKGSICGVPNIARMRRLKVAVARKLKIKQIRKNKSYR